MILTKVTAPEKHAPNLPTTPLLPFFMPYAGCRQRCIFCAQDKQTGLASLDFSQLSRALEQFKRFLREEQNKGRQIADIAFFGGTFTALPGAVQLEFLHTATEFRQGHPGGFIRSIRCSTRPDALGGDSGQNAQIWLRTLKEAGLEMIELGVQSFDNGVLAASGRGYSGDVAKAACLAVQEAGLRLGVQLLPGLPKQTPGIFIKDMETVRELAPETLRLYPCQVIEGSALAGLWRNGLYKPWKLELTVELLSQALLMAWGRGVRVIRLGLAPEPELEAAILAGPRHPALGQMVRARALWSYIKLFLLQHKAACGRSAQRLYVPKRHQGEIFGHANELLPLFAKHGLDKSKVTFWAAKHFAVR